MPGDQVAAFDQHTKELNYEPIIVMLTHEDNGNQIEIRVMKFVDEDGEVATMEVTPSHYIYVVRHQPMI